MLIIKPIMNSCVEDILGFKTCCGLRMFDGNLEILVTNSGPNDVTVSSAFELVTREGVRRIEAVMPQGEHRLPAGETMAFYTQMDETQWNVAEAVTFRESNGTPHTAPIDHETRAVSPKSAR